MNNEQRPIDYSRVIAQENKFVKKQKKSPIRMRHSKRDLRTLAALVAVDVILALPMAVNAIQDKLTDTCVPVGQGVVSPESPVWKLVRNKMGDNTEIRDDVDCTVKNNPNVKIGSTITLYEAK